MFYSFSTVKLCNTIMTLEAKNPVCHHTANRAHLVADLDHIFEVDFSVGRPADHEVIPRALAGLR